MCSMACMWRSGDSFVASVPSMFTCVQISVLAAQVPVPTEPSSQPIAELL